MSHINDPMMKDASTKTAQDYAACSQTFGDLAYQGLSESLDLSPEASRGV